MRIDKSAFNEVYRPYVRESRRYQIFFGGSSSGKSAFLASRCVLDALWGRNVLIVRKVARTLRPSCWNEVLKAMGRLRVRKYFDVSQSEMLITAKQSGGQLIFAGLDDVEKIKSITPAHGVLTDVWMEEATECRYSDYKQLDKRLRGVSVHTKRMTFSFNPIARTHWLYGEFFSGWQDGAEAFPPPAGILIFRHWIPVFSSRSPISSMSSSRSSSDIPSKPLTIWKLSTTASSFFAAAAFAMIFLLILHPRNRS